MENKGLNYNHGIYASIIAIFFLLFGGLILIPIFGDKGAFYACIPVALIGVGFTYFTKTKAKEVFPFALPPIKTFFGAILLSVGVRLISTAVSLAVSLVFDPNVRNDGINSVLLKMSPFEAVIILAVFPAICEEFFCRGFLVRCFSKIKSEKLIILITAVIFGVMHLDPYSFFYTAIFGALLCYVALKTKSLLIPIFLHFTSNALSVLLTFSMESMGEETVSSELVLSLGQNLSMILLYLGLSAIPFFIGYRMFNGKKVKGKALIAVIIASVVITVGAFYLMIVSSIETVDKATDTVEYEQLIDEKLELNVPSKGNYLLSATLNCKDKVEVILMCGEEQIYKKSGSGMIMITYNFQCTDDNAKYYIVIKNAEEESGLSGRLVYSYSLEKVNL